jgi:hypothetical protein
MKRLIGKSKILAVLVLLLAFIVTSSTNAFAWAGHGGGRVPGRGDGRGFSRGGDHRDNSGALFGVLAAGVIFGSILASLPQRSPAVVVAAPPAYPQYPVVDAGSVVINVPNARGGYTAVTLVRYNSGYVGPQGEYYAWCPTVAQLQVLYGN